MPRPMKRRRPTQGAHLAALRKATGLTQAEVAIALGENQQTIARWEVGARPPPSTALPKLAKVLGVAVEDILNTDAPEPHMVKRAPNGKLGKLVEDVSALSRRQQDRFFEFASLFIEQERRKASAP